MDSDLGTRVPVYKNYDFVDHATTIITRLCEQVDKCCPDCKELIKGILKT